MSYQCETDLDLPEVRRCSANFWKAKFFELYKGIVSANKGIRRLKQELEWHKKKNEELLQIINQAGLTPNEKRKETVVMAG